MDFNIEGDPTKKNSHEDGDFSFRQDGDKAEATSYTTEEIKTLGDLIRVCKIDLEMWKIDRWVANKWSMAYKVGKSGEGGHEVVDLYQVKAWLSLNKELIQLREIADQIIGKMKEHSPKTYEPIKYPEYEDAILLELDVPDLHYAMLSWRGDSGGDWDIKITKEELSKALRQLIQDADRFNIERILFPIGNDFFSSDNKDKTTTNGTPQDEDVRWQKSFVTAQEMLVAEIDMLRQIAPVDIVIIPGNHDKQRTFYLGCVLEAWYRNCPDITIDNSAQPRKYYRYGQNLIGFAHGKDEKPQNLPTTMAHEQKELWAQTTFREFHMGHIHHKKDIKWLSSEEFIGTTVRYLRSLTPPNAWATDKGFIGAIRAAEGFLWHKEKGPKGSFTAAIY